MLTKFVLRVKRPLSIGIIRHVNRTLRVVMANHTQASVPRSTCSTRPSPLAIFHAMWNVISRAHLPVSPHLQLARLASSTFNVETARPPLRSAIQEPFSIPRPRPVCHAKELAAHLAADVPIHVWTTPGLAKIHARGKWMLDLNMSIVRRASSYIYYNKTSNFSNQILLMQKGQIFS